MSNHSREPLRTWRIKLDGSPTLVELVPYSGRLWGVPTSFRVGTVEQKLEHPAGLSRRQRANTPLAGSIDVGGHRLTMTLTSVRLSVRAAMRRSFSGLKRSGGDGVPREPPGWSRDGRRHGRRLPDDTRLGIYELSVDGKPSGTWVTKTVDGIVERWIWVPAGGSLPDNRAWTLAPATRVHPRTAVAPPGRRLSR